MFFATIVFILQISILSSLKGYFKKCEEQNAYLCIEKLNRQLDVANEILAIMEQDIRHLRTQKNANQEMLEKIKNEHRVLRDGKYYIRQQLTLAKRGCIGQDRRRNKAVQQLTIAYEMLDLKERALRRRVALIEAELSLTVSKIDVPKPKKEKVRKVPRLEISVENYSRVLPPLINAPRKGASMKSVVHDDFTECNTRNKKHVPIQMSISTTMIQNNKLMVPPSSRRDEAQELEEFAISMPKRPRESPPGRLLNRVSNLML